MKMSGDKLKHPTSHLKFFKELAQATGLRGEEYLPIIKALWYNLLSVLIARMSLKLGSIVTDGRISLLIFLPSGGGKGELKRVIKQVLEKIGKSFVEPTSFHPEQFMGKVRIDNKRGEEKEYVPVKGHLSLDFIIIDEGKELLTSKESVFTESRKYLRQALDTYPNNTVEKKPVDIEHKYALKYEPHCCACIFVQPFKVGENIVLDGDLRRFIVSYIPIFADDKTDIYKARVLEEIDYDGALESFSRFLNSIEVPEAFELTDIAVKIFVDLSVLLINRGKNRSGKNKKLIEMIDFTIQNLLLKFSAIQALQDNSGKIQPKHVELAFIDLSEIMEQVYNFIEDKVHGNLDYGDDLDLKDHEVLKWLADQNATSEETSTVSIKQYKKKICEIFKIGERQARRYKKRHEKMGLIESKMTGQDSKVWLKSHPENTWKGGQHGQVDTDFQEKYKEIIEKYNLK